MTREERSEAISTICDKVGCNSEQRKRHHQLFVDEQWNVHPSKRFKAWWFQQSEYLDSVDQHGEGISPSAAKNAARIWQQYLEAKEIGIA